jgi:dTDP-4-amino-4,6-dideoxygalactose transaminase
MSRSGVATAVHYPTPLHMQPAFAAGDASALNDRDGWRAAQAGSLPHAERAAAEVISLPSFPELEEAEVETVEAALVSWATVALVGASPDPTPAAP